MIFGMRLGGISVIASVAGLATVGATTGHLAAQAAATSAQTRAAHTTRPTTLQNVDLRQVHISRDRLRRIAPDSLLTGNVPVITRDGRDSAQLVRGELALQAGQFAVLRTGEPLREVAGPSAGGRNPAEAEPFYALPIRLVTPDANLSGAWVLRPVFKVARRLRWEPEQRVFAGAIFLALEDSMRRRESKRLQTPVRFQVVGTDADSIDPSEFALEHTNFPLRRVNVTARRVTDSLRVHIIPEFDVAGVDVWLPVEPTLRIEATPPRIQGWGVQTAHIVVRAVGASASRPESATVISTAGDLDSVVVALGAGGTGSVKIRSRGTGIARLDATATGWADGQTTIEYVWPWVFVLAALLGSMFGGLVSAVLEQRGRKRIRWGEHALKGMLAGILAAVAWYALGVNLLQIDVGVPRQNELAVFAFSALAGFFAPRMLAPAEPKHA